MKNFHYLLLCIGLLFILNYCVVSIPFFWDDVNYAEWASFYLKNRFSSLLIPATVPLNHPPLFPLYLATMWSIFGKTLAVSHWILFPFAVGMIWEYYKLAKRFLSENLIPYALLLLLTEPTFLTRFILPGPEIMLGYFFLLSLNALLRNNKIIYSLSLCLLVMMNIRGYFTFIPLMIFHFSMIYYFQKEKIKIVDFILYIPVVALTAIWGYYFYTFDKEFLSTPAIKNISHVASFTQVIRNTLYILWKIIDFGRGFLYLFLCISLMYVFVVQKKYFSFQYRKLLLLILLLFAVFIIVLAPFANPICHRYFLVIYLLTLIAVVHQFQYIGKRVYRAVLFLFFVMGLITGNFWLYPERLGNGWDASLKCIPYFKLEKEMVQFVREKKINPKLIGTGFSLNTNLSYANLDSMSFQFSDKDSIPFHSFQYILHSNICNNFTVQEMDELQKKWILITEFKTGLVYMRLYKNKAPF